MVWEIFLLENVDWFLNMPQPPNMHSSSPWLEKNIQMPSSFFLLIFRSPCLKINTSALPMASVSFMPWGPLPSGIAFEVIEHTLNFLRTNMLTYGIIFEDILQPRLFFEQTVLNYLSLCKISWTSTNANIFNLWKQSVPIFSLCIFSFTGIFSPDSFYDVRNS